jgi:hypothetical protein
MSEQIDPIEMLHAVDPIDPQTMPSASLARVSAKVQEILMSETEPTPARTSPVRRRGIFLGFAGAVAAVAVIAFVAMPRGVPSSPGGAGGVAVLPSSSAAAPSETPTTTTVPSEVPPTEAPPSDGPITPGGGGMAMCIQYSTEILKGFDFGFDGTVTAIEGDQITFAVNTAYKGITGTSVTLTSPGSGVVEQGAGLDFAVGDHLLVAGAGTTISGCGYTQPYDPAVAAEWAKAFGG